MSWTTTYGQYSSYGLRGSPSAGGSTNSKPRHDSGASSDSVGGLIGFGVLGSAGSIRFGVVESFGLSGRSIPGCSMWAVISPSSFAKSCSFVWTSMVPAEQRPLGLAAIVVQYKPTSSFVRKKLGSSSVSM